MGEIIANPHYKEDTIIKRSYSYTVTGIDPNGSLAVRGTDISDYECPTGYTPLAITRINTGNSFQAITGIGDLSLASNIWLLFGNTHKTNSIPNHQMSFDIAFIKQDALINQNLVYSLNCGTVSPTLEGNQDTVIYLDVPAGWTYNEIEKVDYVGYTPSSAWGTQLFVKGITKDAEQQKWRLDVRTQGTTSQKYTVRCNYTKKMDGQ